MRTRGDNIWSTRRVNKGWWNESLLATVFHVYTHLKLNVSCNILSSCCCFVLLLGLGAMTATLTMSWTSLIIFLNLLVQCVFIFLLLTFLLCGASLVYFRSGSPDYPFGKMFLMIFLRIITQMIAWWYFVNLTCPLIMGFCSFLFQWSDRWSWWRLS